MCVCVCVCVYIHTYTYINAYTPHWSPLSLDTLPPASALVCVIFLCQCVCVCVCARARVCTSPVIHTRPLIHTYTHPFSTHIFRSFLHAYKPQQSIVLRNSTQARHFFSFPKKTCRKHRSGPRHLQSYCPKSRARPPPPLSSLRVMQYVPAPLPPQLSRT